MSIHWHDHILFILMGILLPIIAINSHALRHTEEDPHIIIPDTPKIHLFYSNGLMLLIGALLVITSWNAGHNDWSKLGFNLIATSPILWWAVGSLIMLYLIDLIVNRQMYTQDNTDQIMETIIPTTFKEYGHFLFLAFTAGIAEEIIFRGFMINYLKAWFAGYSIGTTISIVVPALVFGLTHLYQGIKNMIKIIAIALLLGLIYHLSESLIIVVILHILVDVISGYVAMMALNKST